MDIQYVRPLMRMLLMGGLFFAFCIIICKLWFRKLPDYYNKCNCPSESRNYGWWWLRKENSLHMDRGMLLPLPSALSAPDVSPHLNFSSESWGPERHTFPATLLHFFFQKNRASVLTKEHIFLLNLYPSSAPDINALKPYEDHLLAGWSQLQDSLANNLLLQFSYVYHGYSIPSGFPFPQETLS